MEMPTVSIIIVTYNSEKYLEKCLYSVINQHYKSIEVIVFDNASSDGTRNILQKYNKEIHTLYSKENLGFASGNNHAVGEAKGKYLFLLNPDAVITADALFPLVEEMEKHSNIAACQPTVLLYKGKSINLTGKIPHFLGFDWIKDYKMKITPKKSEIFSISGSAVLLRKSVMKKISLFDDYYFMYYEDSDLSWRLRMYGYEMVYIPSSIVRHDYTFLPHGGAEKLSQKMYYLERNRIINLIKNYELHTLLLLLPLLLFTEFGMIGLAIMQGWFIAKIRSYISLIKLIDKIFTSRKHIQRTRIRLDKDLISGFSEKLPAIFSPNTLLLRYVNMICSTYWSWIKVFV